MNTPADCIGEVLPMDTGVQKPIKDAFRKGSYAFLHKHAHRQLSESKVSGDCRQDMWINALRTHVVPSWQLLSYSYSKTPTKSGLLGIKLGIKQGSILFLTSNYLELAISTNSTITRCRISLRMLVVAIFFVSNVLQ